MHSGICGSRSSSMIASLKWLRWSVASPVFGLLLAAASRAGSIGGREVALSAKRGVGWAVIGRARALWVQAVTWRVLPAVVKSALRNKAIGGPLVHRGSVLQCNALPSG